MADSNRSNAAPFINPDPDNMDHLTEPRIKSEFDQSDYIKFGPSGRRDEASRFGRGSDQTFKWKHDDDYYSNPPHAQYGNTYRRNPSSATPPPPPPPHPPLVNGVLRYELDRYIPLETYFDYDMFSLVRDAGVGGDKANCFGCSRPKTICPGFPNCPRSAICVACTQPFRTPSEIQAICPTYWASTAFLVRYVNWDLRTGLPNNVQIKPNEQGARCLESQGFLRISEYRNHLNQKGILNHHFKHVVPQQQVNGFERFALLDNIGLTGAELEGVRLGGARVVNNQAHQAELTRYSND